MDMMQLHKDLEFLTSPEAEGRLSGTSGAKKAAEYLAHELKIAGYKPIGTDGFFDRVDVPATRLMGPASLSIGEQHYNYRSDFSEFMHVSAGGIVEAQLVILRDGDDIEPDALKDKAVLIPERPDGFDLNGTVESAEEFGVKALLIEDGEPDFFPKTIFGRKENRIPVLRIRTTVANEMSLYAGNNVKLQLPLQTAVLPCQNVLGFLGSDEQKPTVLLTAHYDHLGDDPDGFQYPGAVDNGSGVSVILQIARRLSNSSEPLPFNVLVAFLTGEESGMWGARQLAENPPRHFDAVINIDSLGFEKELVALRVGHSAPGHWLPDLAAKIIEGHGVQVKWISGGDDSYAFLTKGLPTLGIGQKPTQTNSIKIHTPADDLDSLHLKPLETGCQIVMEVLSQLGKIDEFTRLQQRLTSF